MATTSRALLLFAAIALLLLTTPTHADIADEATVVIIPVGGPYDKIESLPGSYTEIDATALGTVEDFTQVSTIAAKLHNDDTAVSVVFSQVSATKDTWYGEDDTDMVGVAKFAVSEDGRVSGAALFSDFAYKITTQADGRVFAARIAQEDFFEEGDPICKEGEGMCTEDKESVGNDAGGGGNGLDIPEGTDLSLEEITSQDEPIDILVAYTYRAMCADAGLPAGCAVTDENKKSIEETALLSVSFADEVYIASGAKGQMRLVHTYMVDEGYDDADPRGYQEMLDEITATDDGVLDEVHTIRDKYGADLVSLLVENNQYCGLAWVYQVDPAAGFSVVQRECSAAYLTLAHETAHNIGCMHNREDTSQERKFAHGYQDPESRFRTVMAYNTCPGGSCPKIPFFSTPDFTWRGNSVGDDTHNNALKLNENWSQVSKFRQAVVDDAVIVEPNTTNPEPSSSGWATPICPVLVAFLAAIMMGPFL